MLVILALALGLGLGLGLPQGGGSTTPAPPRVKWRPVVGDTWQIVLENAIQINPSSPSIQPSNVKVYDIDLYTNSAATFTALHQLNKKVICYFSAGSYEPYRPDSKDFLKADLGSVLDGWPDEKWINIRSTNVRQIMAKRIKLASDKGCDAIDPDNVDGFANKNGLSLKAADAVSYLRFLSDEAGKYNMSMGLKNAGDIVPSVISFLDFAVNEECATYDECDLLQPFIAAGKAVFHVEYPKGAPNNIKASLISKICGRTGTASGAVGFSTVLKKLSLDGYARYCNGDVYNTPLASR